MSLTHRGAQGDDLRNGGVNQSFRVILGGDVSSERDGFSSSSLDLIDDRLRLLEVQIRDNDLCSLGGKQNGGASSDSLRSSSNDGDFAVVRTESAAAS